MDAKAPKLGKAKAAKFLDDAQDAPAEEGKMSGGAINYKKENEEAIANESVDKATGKSVRKTYINKKKH